MKLRAASVFATGTELDLVKKISRMLPFMSGRTLLLGGLLLLPVLSPVEGLTAEGRLRVR